MVKNLPAMWQIWARSLGWEDPLEKGKATHCSIPGLENSMVCTVHGVSESQMQLSLSLNIYIKALFFNENEEKNATG